MAETDLTWYLAQLKPNSSRIAQTNLERQAFPTFLPLEERTQTRNGRFVTRLDPLFPGYIFVALDPAKGDWRKVNATRGITKLVSLGSAPTPVPSDIVDELIARCAADGRLQVDPDFAVGDTVTIKSGPFSSVTAEILQVEPDRRIWVLMDVMGRQTRAAIDRKDLRH